MITSSFQMISILSWPLLEGPCLIICLKYLFAFISIIIFFKAKAEETKVENTVPPTTEKTEIEKPEGEIEVKEQLIVNEVQPEGEGGGTWLRCIWVMGSEFRCKS